MRCGCDPPAHLNQLSQPAISFSSPGHSATINMSDKNKNGLIIAEGIDPNDNNKSAKVDAEMVLFLQGLLKVVSFICWIVGICMTYAGQQMVLQIHMYVDLPSDMTRTVPFLVIGLGVLMVVIDSYAFLFIHSCRKGPMFYILYAIYLICVGLMMLGLQISLEYYREALNKGIADGLKRNIQNYNSVTTKLDMIQSTFQCCGIENSNDWLQHSPKSVIPKSCCINRTNCDENYDKGCDAALKIFLCERVEKITTMLRGFIWYPAFGITPALIIFTYNVRGKICSDP